MLGETYHGGFKVGDEVDLKTLRGSWLAGYIIVGFYEMDVILEGTYSRIQVSMNRIRHSHLVQEKKDGV